MALIYKFEKVVLESGVTIMRPKILVSVKGDSSSVEVSALIDSGADCTIIPEGIARAIGLDFNGRKHDLWGFREVSQTVESRASLTFMGRAQRDSVNIVVPVLIALRRPGEEEDADLVLGIQGIFDAFDIMFKKTQNRILFREHEHSVLRKIS